MRRPSATSSYLCVHRTCGELDLRPATVHLHAVDTVRLPVGYPSATPTSLNFMTQIYPHLAVLPNNSFILDRQIDSGAYTYVYIRLRAATCGYVGLRASTSV
ncbi:hypothetical protein C8R44DRAFT_854714 [Mycena epipterygia]|nr:hypothetical protein C8R44DRAFT_854714 [Mycena epipterygia]